jgi:hypothetical protein
MSEDVDDAVPGWRWRDAATRWRDAARATAFVHALARMTARETEGMLISWGARVP